MKSLKIEWKDFALGFFIGVTICLYSYVTRSDNVETPLIRPSATITDLVVD